MADFNSTTVLLCVLDDLGYYEASPKPSLLKSTQFAWPSVGQYSMRSFLNLHDRIYLTTSDMITYKFCVEKSIIAMITLPVAYDTEFIDLRNPNSINKLKSLISEYS